MIKKAMEYAKNPVDEKVGFSFQVPVSLKKDFEKVCKLNNVTMTNLILGFMKATVEEYPDYSTFSIGELLDTHYIVKNQLKDNITLTSKLSKNEIAMNEKKWSYIFEEMEKLQKEIDEIEAILDSNNIKYSKYEKEQK